MRLYLMNSRKPAALAAGFCAVRVSDYKICVVIAILCKKVYNYITILCKKRKCIIAILCNFQ